MRPPARAARPARACLTRGARATLPGRRTTRERSRADREVYEQREQRRPDINEIQVEPALLQRSKAKRGCVHARPRGARHAIEHEIAGMRVEGSRAALLAHAAQRA